MFLSRFYVPKGPVVHFCLKNKVLSCCGQLGHQDAQTRIQTTQGGGLPYLISREKSFHVLMTHAKCNGIVSKGKLYRNL